ncbi:hypothetical protein QWY77_00910 [Thalassotalea ponticola]|uniref:hypothetical protein n=1 Tax=Thalassotalea ponticola TaxID=1523392 RepID=UPI0025B4B7F9|nr:hypothetical protein [Thalassotalea ponticola]MDN3651345.1 hypothetical protein [Thalassotalea ponticola]
MSATEEQLIRRCCRLLRAVHELHKQGYQNLAIYTGMSSSGGHWRVQLVPFYDVFIDNDDNIACYNDGTYEQASHSSGLDGNLYFGWEDAITLNARQLAERIKERFPRLLTQCKANNFEYAGWLTYILGNAEKGILPVMYRDYYSSPTGYIQSTSSEGILTPPHRKLHQRNGRKFVYADPNHLTINDDWHTAYISIIDNLRSASVAKYPEYPIAGGDIFQIGSYWEGAIYYIYQILGISRIDEFLLMLDKCHREQELWNTFFDIWDSQDQLVYLKAFLVRQMLLQSDKYKLSSQDKVYWENYLERFEKKYSHKQSTFKNPNPYFGGNNPLHLGLVLDDLEHAKRLI